jgi:hypothetical protein
MTIESDDRGVLVVRGDIADYIIEPIRFDLGLSRVEMVDDHLRVRAESGGWQDSADVDALLAARLVFENEESDDVR